MIELVPPGTHIDFISRWKIAAMISIAIIAAGLAALPFRLAMGIDFAGGWEIQVRFDESVATDETDIRLALDDLAEGVSVVRFGSDYEYLVRFAVQEGEDPNAPIPVAAVPAAIEAVEEAVADPPGETTPTQSDEASDGDVAEEPEPAATDGAAVAEAAAASAESADRREEAAESSEGTGTDVATPDAVPVLTSALSQGQRADQLRDRLAERIGPVSLERVEFVGPRVGEELRRAGLLSLALAGLMILIYISFRFTFRFAPGAIVALLHDVLLTSGLWILMGREFNLQVLAALLAIVGYSLNDTIIVYDRIRENMELRTTANLHEVLNRSINQTLSRTILTSITTLLAVLSLLLLGGEVIRPFATAMAIGILIGTYSSVFVAAPVLLWLESRHSEATA